MPKIPNKKQGKGVCVLLLCLVGVFVAVCVLLWRRRNDRLACRPQQHSHHAPKMENFQSIVDWGQNTFAEKAGQCTTEENCCREGYHPHTLFSPCACWKNGKKWLKKNPDYVTPDCDGDAAEDADEATSSP